MPVENKEARLIRRVGEMVEGYEAGGSSAAEMQIIRDEWRKYKSLPPRGRGPDTHSTHECTGPHADGRPAECFCPAVEDNDHVKGESGS